MSVVTHRYPASDAAAVRGVPSSYRKIGAIMVAADMLAIQIASVATGTFYHLAALGSYGDIGVFFGTGLLVGYLFVSVMQVRGAYQPSKLAGPHTGHGELALVWLAVFLSLAGIAFVLHVSASFSRGAVLSFFAVGFAGLWAVRASMRHLTRRALDGGLLNSERDRLHRA